MPESYAGRGKSGTRSRKSPETAARSPGSGCRHGLVVVPVALHQYAVGNPLQRRLDLFSVRAALDGARCREFVDDPVDERGRGAVHLAHTRLGEPELVAGAQRVATVGEPVERRLDDARAAPAGAQRCRSVVPTRTPGFGGRSESVPTAGPRRVHSPPARRCCAAGSPASCASAGRSPSPGPSPATRCWACRTPRPDRSRRPPPSHVGVPP